MESTSSVESTPTRGTSTSLPVLKLNLPHCRMHEAMCSPHLNACIPEDLQSGPDISLELVLHPGETQELHLHLQTLNHCSHLQRAVVDAELGLNVTGLEKKQ